MPSPFRFYVDDSGSRDPDKSRSHQQEVDWFGLGGILVRESDLPALETEVAAFRQRWPNPSAPLHSSEIRLQKGGFSWLRSTSGAKRTRFLGELTDIMTGLPITVHACVVDRPGYNKRYLAQYGPRRWFLCRTAFKIAIERAAKYAQSEKRRLRVYIEQSDRLTERRMRGYYDQLRVAGTPFDAANSAKYGPLSVEELSATLMEFKVKTKASVAMQLADLALWPVCKGKYEPTNIAYQVLVEKGKLLDAKCTDENGLWGIKYSCFD